MTAFDQRKIRRMRGGDHSARGSTCNGRYAVVGLAWASF